MTSGQGLFTTGINGFRSFNRIMFPILAGATQGPFSPYLLSLLKPVTQAQYMKGQ